MLGHARNDVGHERALAPRCYRSGKTNNARCSIHPRACGERLPPFASRSARGFGREPIEPQAPIRS
jgi:hypothetical protein